MVVTVRQTGGDTHEKEFGGKLIEFGQLGKGMKERKVPFQLGVPGQFHIWEYHANISELMSSFPGPGHSDYQTLLYFLAFLKVLSFSSLRFFRTREVLKKKTTSEISWKS